MRSAYKVVTLIIIVVMTIVGLLIFLIDSEKVKVRISITTSLYISGLPEFLAREFRKLYPDVEIVFIAVGSGAALEYAKRGNVCAVFVHAPSLERKYLELNAIEDHRIFAYNIFVVVGPNDDPANISKAMSIQHVFSQIYGLAKNRKAVFISRGDSSGTHIREISIWRAINVSVDGDWYKECGCSADQALMIANELKAYTLTDIVTYIILKRKGVIPNVKALYVNYSDPLAINIYSMYTSSNCNNIKEKEYAEVFLKFVYQNQHLIEKFNEALGFNGFFPAKGKEMFLRRIWEEITEVDTDE